jgi:queuine tRNA-ribosyltransferase
MFQLISKRKCRRGRFNTVDGVFETPAYMNVATAGPSAAEFPRTTWRILVSDHASNTYHQHLRPAKTLSGAGELGVHCWKGVT